MRESVANSWQQITRYKSGEFLALDEYVVMPNHFHGILILKDGYADLQKEGSTAHLVGTTIGTFKSLVTKRVRALLKMGDTPFPVWQRGYYDRVVRNEREYHAIQKYIQENPQRWAEDRDNLDRLIAKMNHHP